MPRAMGHALVDLPEAAMKHTRSTGRCAQTAGQSSAAGTQPLLRSYLAPEDTGSALEPQASERLQAAACTGQGGT